MNDAKRRGPDDADREQEPGGRGPNLTLVYSLIAVAMLVAIGIAAMIVLPFYHRR